MKIDKATVKDVAKDWVRDKMSVFETRKIIILFNNCHMANTGFACIGGRGMGELVSSSGTIPHCLYPVLVTQTSLLISLNSILYSIRL